MDTAIKIPGDAAWARLRLQTYGLHQDNVAVFERYPAFNQQLQDILNAKRHSTVTDNEQRLYLVTHRKYKNQNEDTLINKLIPLFIKDHRTVPQPLVDRAGITEAEEQVSVAFIDSGLVEISNREFSKAVTFVLDGDSDLNKALQKDANFTNPKPDRTFAVDLEKIRWPLGFHVPSTISALLEVMRSCCHPFCILEAKSVNGSMEDARNQACRDGAYLIFYERFLRALVGETDVSGPDTRTFVFSIVLSPDGVEIWVHWALVPDKDSKDTDARDYHMNLLYTKAVADKEALGPIRKVIHNILDWGIGRRFDALKPLHDNIVAFGRKRAEEAAEAKTTPNKKAKHG
ncbi:MAG: hypothetical protein LQ338_007520 [Usnochroma carphineum]|nr:MAG: hypothetical protein LQ338_007520 [Usnochroma carphineum]